MHVTENQVVQDLSLEFTEADWDQESYELFGERMDPRPCPKCGRTGFFGPRAADPGLKFRSCRFCGFSQEVNCDPVQFLPVVHSCDDWPVCAKAPYVWWVHPSEERFTCPFCGRDSDVRSRNVFTPGVLSASPAETEDHAWHKVPQGRPYSYYLRFWENWEFTRGRVIL